MRFFKRIGTCLSFIGTIVPVFFQLLYGVWRVSRLQRPVVSIFGSARFKNVDFYFSKAQSLALKLAQEDISILTGGGPGIMEAASCGVIKREKGYGDTLGISVTDLGEGKNPCVEHYFELDHFFARKWLLTHYSQAFVVFPGGFGTFDELGEILTLFQTKRIPPQPIVLIGMEYWNGLMTWLKNEVLAHGAISEEDLKLFIITDDIEVAFNIIREACLEFSIKQGIKK